MSTPNIRPVHPCVLSVWEGNAGAEYSTWANISDSSRSSSGMPDLVTAQGSTLTIFKMEESTGKLLIHHRFSNLAGHVCFLGTLKTPDPHGSSNKSGDSAGDALVVGFVGNPRLAVVTITPDLLLATSLLDLTLALQEQSYGAIETVEEDLQASLFQSSPNMATLTVILGGGVVVACLQLHHDSASGWTTAQPYLLPLQAMSPTEDTTTGTSKNASTGSNNSNANPNANANQSSIMTGFGDIISASFLTGYSEPTLVLLHSNPQTERTWSGRLGRTEGANRSPLVVTAVTVTVTHERSAVLWTTEVPADALQVYGAGVQGCLVHCVNAIVSVNNTGQVQQTLATNGWASTTLPQSLSATTNPWPFPQLSVGLDGAEFAFVNDTTVFIVLRGGQVYLLQHTNAWSLLPLFTTVGALGEVSTVQSWPLGNVLPGSLDVKLWDKGTTKGGKPKSAPSSTTPMEMGLLFVGSRLGDSSLLGYALEKTSVANAIQQEPGFKTKREGNGFDKSIKSDGDVDEEYDRILQLEEEALYAPTDEGTEDGRPNIIPSSDDDDDDEDNTVALLNTPGSTTRRKRARLSQLTVVRSLTVLDALTALGPLGPGCVGPLSQGQSEISATTGTAPPALGATGYIYPCGFGSSGGLALLTVPGRDDRTILAEEDCINAKALFNLPTRGLLLLSMVDKIRFLKLEENAGAGQCLAEVDMAEWTSMELRTLFKTCDLLAACERSENSFVLLISMKVDTGGVAYSLLVVNDGSGKLEVETSIPLPVPDGESIRSVAPMTKQDSGQVVIAYTLSTGEAKIVTLEEDGAVQGFTFDANIPMDMDEEELTAEEKFYKWGTVMAVDVFKAPKSFFSESPFETEPQALGSAETANENDTFKEVNKFDEDDEDLYAETTKSSCKNLASSKETQPRVSLKEEVWFVALARQSGALEVYNLDSLIPGQKPSPLWTSRGCGHGVPLLIPKQQDGSAYRIPKQHKVQAVEIRFFFCGPSLSKEATFMAGPRSFCLSIETSVGDAMLYSAELENQTMALKAFRRIHLKSPGRPSKEQDKHFVKLRRKGIVKNSGDDSSGGFRHNCLFRFNRVSGQDGLFAAIARPIWFVSERGLPTVLCHRSRHVAPSGSRPRPVAGFCSGILSVHGREPGFMTLHERVGRVGSQRLTVFSGILNLASSHGIIPGGGYFIEKIPMGVTVRRIQFIDNPSVCGSRPLYAVLVSREIEEDLSNLNDDGLAPEERQRLTEEKESAKIKRQVEADLGGFDMEQEWVEAIARENCFKVDKTLGGAPPMSKTAYSLWIVDAASGWVVLDSYEFEDFEHGLTMQVMSLSEFMAEPGNSNAEPVSEEDLDVRMFITVGTGIVDKDGEDVGSKGRIVLLELTKPSPSSSVELNFVYEKKIFHGPVNSLSCLSSEGKHRLIIGAGADVNVEQWGNGKLTQVGFFRATMHVLDIKLFKNFLVLSDAYDSLFFLVWRESDKSLTLLAKDYDPIPVYAAGLLSRGGSLDLVCHDDRQNLQFFQYAPGDAAARGGNKLVCRADYHLGSQTIDLQSHFCRSSVLVNSATPASTIAALQQQDAFFGRSDDDQRLGVHFGTTDGEYGTIIPLSEPIYWRLTALQSVMVNALESDCALSQRAWRLYRRSARRGGCRENERKKGVIDGDFVIQFADLAVADQEDLASSIGSTVDLIIDNLLELRCSVMII